MLDLADIRLSVDGFDPTEADDDVTDDMEENAKAAMDVAARV